MLMKGDGNIGEGCRTTCRTEMTELGCKLDDKGWDTQKAKLRDADMEG